MIGVLDEYLAKDCTLQDAFAAYIATQQSQGKKCVVAEKNAAQLGPYGDIRLDESTRFLLQMDLYRFLHDDLIVWGYLDASRTSCPIRNRNECQVHATLGDSRIRFGNSIDCSPGIGRLHPFPRLETDG